MRLVKKNKSKKEFKIKYDDLLDLDLYDFDRKPSINLVGGVDENENEIEEEKKTQELLKKISIKQSLDEALKNYKGTDVDKSLFKNFINYQSEKNMEDTEGLYLFGINLPTVFQYIQEELENSSDDVDYPGKYKSEKERLEAEEKKKIKEIERKQKEESNKNKTSFELTGEHIDEDYEKIMKEILGIRKDLTESILQPQKTLTETSTFLEIITEAKKYQKTNKTELNPKALLNMCHMLFSSKNNYIQWQRVATLCETIYNYLGKNASREQFFSSSKKLNELSILKLEEFWKTDWIFRSKSERKIFKNNLLFYHK